MKRLKILLVLCLSFTLTGCIEEYTLPEEKSDEVAEYMAGVLLKADKNYDQALVSEEEISSNINDEDSTTTNGVTEPTAAPIATDSTDVPSEDNSNASQTDKASDLTNNYSIDEVIGLKDFNISYSKYKLADTYPEDVDTAGFSLTPRSGYRLLIVSFNARNKSDTEKELKLLESGIFCHLDIKDGTVYKPLLTLLENDLQYIDIKVDGGKNQEAVLVFELSKDTDMSNVSLTVENGEKSKSIEIK